MADEFLLCGKVLTTHGIRGAIKVESYCDTPAVLAGLPTVYIGENNHRTEYAVRTGAVHGHFVLLTLAGIDTPEAAATLRERELYACRADIPCGKNRVFLADIVGLPVIDADTGRVYGHVREVTEAPASLLYEIDTGKETVLFPAVPQFIREIDTARGVFIRPIDGFFD